MDTVPTKAEQYKTYEGMSMYAVIITGVIMTVAFVSKGSSESDMKTIITNFNQKYNKIIDAWTIAKNLKDEKDPNIVKIKSIYADFKYDNFKNIDLAMYVDAESSAKTAKNVGIAFAVLFGLSCIAGVYITYMLSKETKTA